jgi:hypothetical protein
MKRARRPVVHVFLVRPSKYDNEGFGIGHVSFAKNRSASISLCCNAFITIMQAAGCRERTDSRGIVDSFRRQEQWTE